MQVLDNEKAHDNKKDSHLAGSRYDMVDVGRDVAKPAGEWNHAIIRIKDGHLTLKLNGTETADVTIGSEEWKKLIAASKFKDWEHFGRYTKGRSEARSVGKECVSQCRSRRSTYSEKKKKSNKKIQNQHQKKTKHGREKKKK